MQKYLWSVVLVAMAVSLSFGVATATAAKGGNSENAKLCQKGGWMNVQGSDGTQFANQDECVSFGAHGGTIVPKPPCTAGSDNFSDDALGSQPTTFAGGTIDGPYEPSARISVVGSDWGQSTLPNGTHLLFFGFNAGPFRLSFSNPVGSVQLDVDRSSSSTRTLKAYDASDAVVDTDAATTIGLVTLSVSSATNNIEYFTLEVDNDRGLGFTNIVWGCAA